MSAHYPKLPIDREWPSYMIGDGEVKERLRENYARIAHATYADRQYAARVRRAVKCHDALVSALEAWAAYDAMDDGDMTAMMIAYDSALEKTRAAIALAKGDDQ